MSLGTNKEAEILPGGKSEGGSDKDEPEELRVEPWPTELEGARINVGLDVVLSVESAKEGSRVGDMSSMTMPVEASSVLPVTRYKPSSKRRCLDASPTSSFNLFKKSVMVATLVSLSKVLPTLLSLGS